MIRFNPGLDYITDRLPTNDEINKFLAEADRYKRQQMLKYKSMYNLTTFVETGSFLGDTIEEMRHHFNDVYSIELDMGYAINLMRRFKGVSNVHLTFGDSSVFLKSLMSNIPHENILFWLDAHAGNPIRDTKNPTQNYRGLMGVGQYDFSGLIELEYLLNLELKNCVIMVDDIGDDPGKVCIHGGCGCINELMRIAPNCELEMSVARIKV